MDGEGTRDAADVWASATSSPGDLPAVRQPSQVALRTDVDVTSRAVLTVLGVVDTLVAVLEKGLGQPGGAPRAVADVALGATWRGFRVSARVVGGAAALGSPVVRVLVDPPFLPTSIRPATLAAGAAGTWRTERTVALRYAAEARDAIVPATVDAAIAPIDLTGLVLDRVQLEPIVARALDQLDLTSLVLDRVRLQTIVVSALDQLDLTEVVLERVDLDRVVNSALDGLDLNAVARERMDLPALAQEVIDAVDLPEIIRASTGSVASEGVRALRMQSITADDGIQRVVDRVMLRRRARKTDAPGDIDDFSDNGRGTESPGARP